jgi:ATP/maltotriose-dependent transcriptional regulator MalT
MSAPWRFVDRRALLLLHGESLAEHGGAGGIRDAGLLDSALSRPQNLALYGEPDAAELAALMKRTDGWAAGMTLLSAASERLTTPAALTFFIDQLAHNNRYIFDYLAESVLNREDSATRTFLIATAIFDELHPTLCRAVTGQADADSLLHALFRRNLFVMRLETSDGSQAGASLTIYRYHDLFRDFLREQLRRQPSEYVRALHQRAAETIEQRARPRISEQPLHLAFQLGWLVQLALVSQPGEFGIRHGGPEEIGDT